MGFSSIRIRGKIKSSLKVRDWIVNCEDHEVRWQEGQKCDGVGNHCTSDANEQPSRWGAGGPGNRRANGYARTTLPA
jgi:hypothetical protein